MLQTPHRITRYVIALVALGGRAGPLGCGGTTAPHAAAPATAPATPPAATTPVASAHEPPPPGEDPDDSPVPPPGGTQPAPAPPAGLAVATFAGGCFWCMESAFEHVRGVRDAISGYTGGPEQHPSYEQVSNHQTQQAESVRVLFDPAVVTYDQLLDTFWRHIDATDRDQSFADSGHQYRSVVFVHSPEQRAAAERVLAQQRASGRFEGPLYATIEDAPPVFWVAEDYHQNFWRTHPHRFYDYHEHSGRREYLRAHWGPDADY